MSYNLRRSEARRIISGLLATTMVIAAVTPAAFANLSGSTFEGNDGNLVVDTAGNTDWSNVANRVVGLDQPSGSSDNSFGQGTKEDGPNTVVVTGSIPPNKNDLTRFYAGSEFTGGSNFLYLAWERAVNIGAANLDFEISQNATVGFNGSTTGPVTLNRTAGDLLITYDFGGSGTPTLGLLKWVTTGPASQCFSANTVPCWGNRVDLTGLGEAEGAVNTGSVTDPVPPNAPRTLGTGLFGEAAINLTAAGVFPANVCTGFGSVFVKSRSSTSFTAEIKDFIAPQPVNISNCGEIKVIKHTNPRGIDQDFSFTSTVPGNTSFTLNDKGNTTGDSAGNTRDMTNIQAGTYQVNEPSEPNSSFVFDSLTCSATGAGTAVTTSGTQASITLGANGVVTCTYVNKQQLGAIKVSKTSTKGNTPLADATFSITSGGTPISGSPFTTNASGVVCVDGLVFGDYKVTETGAPTGYSINDTTTHTVTVDNNAKCSDATFVGESLSFSDTPLSKIEVIFTSLAGANVTNASIACTKASVAVAPVSENGAADPALDDTDEVFTNLAPGTYSCTVVVDP
jgi:hypothetical protein